MSTYAGTEYKSTNSISIFLMKTPLIHNVNYIQHIASRKIKCQAINNEVITAYFFDCTNR